MDEDDNQIKQFIKKDQKIPKSINNTFERFIENVEKDNIYKNQINNDKSQSKEKSIYLLKFKQILAVAASLLIIMVGSNVYARTQGYDNIFFLIKNIVIKNEIKEEDIFSDRDIVISYNSIQITKEIELQINELQIKDNKAKLYLLVKELSTNDDSPIKYKVYNSDNQEMYNSVSNKKQEETIYSDVLLLKNYKDSCNEIKMEIYNKNNILLKTIKIDLLKKAIEARTENQVVKKISQIELNKFIKSETEKLYTKVELKDKKIIIIDTYDIFYSEGKYTAKYLYMMPSDEEFKNDTVEKTTIYTNTIEFTHNDEEFIKTKIEKPEIF